MQNFLGNWRITVFGLLSWVIPFAAAIPFFTPDGGLLIPQPLFKSLMVLIGGGTGTILLVWAFQRLRPSIITGLLVGIYWLAINLILDLLILVPMSGQTPLEYFYDIGLRYFVLPITATALAYMGRAKA